MAQQNLQLLYFVSHPIQYQAPLLRYLHKMVAVDLQVLFREAISENAYHDVGFGCDVKWDTPLLEGYTYQSLLQSGRRKNLKIFALLKYFFCHRFDVLWLHGYATWSDWLAMMIAKLKGAKVLVRGESVPQFSHGSSLKRFLRPIFFKVLNFFVDAYLAIGTENRRFYKNKGVSDRQLFFAPYTVDNHFFQDAVKACAEKREALRAELGLQAGRPIILFASKMQARKHADDLLAAYARLVADYSKTTMPYLLFIGDGEMRENLEASAEKQGLDAVQLLGFKNQSELPAYFDLCDVFVLPSVRENWGLIVNEVMNAARAVIVSDQVGCAVDLVKPGENGMIYPARDIDALHAALVAVLSDPKRLVLMGKNALARINDWGIAQTASGILEACYSVSGRKNEK